MERLPAEHPAASGPPLRADGEPQGHPGGVGTMTLQRPPEPSPDDVPVGATLAPQPPKNAWSRGSLSPRNWKVRTKLAAVLLVPAIAFLVIAGINMGTQIGNARDYGRSANVAEFGRQASTLVHELQAERDIAAGWIGEGRRPNNQAAIDKVNAENEQITKQNENRPPGQDPIPLKGLPLPSIQIALQAQQRNVDTALSAYQSADASLGDVSPEAQAAVDAARSQLAGLPQLRQALNRQLLTEGAITDKYSAMVGSLLDINRQIGVGTDSTELNNEVAGLTALGDLKETLSQERALLYSVTANGGLNTAQDLTQTRKGGRFQFGQQVHVLLGSRRAAGRAAAVPLRGHAGPGRRVRRAGQRPGRAGGQAARGQHHRRPELAQPDRGRRAVVLGSHHLHAGDPWGRERPAGPGRQHHQGPALRRAAAGDHDGCDHRDDPRHRVPDLAAHRPVDDRPAAAAAGRRP